MPNGKTLIGRSVSGPMPGPAAARWSWRGGIAAIVAYAAYRGSVDWNPDSLWLDDAWVAALARHLDGQLLWAQSALAPAGFKALVALGLGLSRDLEVGAQLFPFVSALAAIPLSGILALRMTGSRLSGLVAAGIVACDPLLLVYMARVKPYSLDVLVVVLQGLCFHSLLESYERRRLWRYAAVTTGGFLFSSLSLFAAAAGTAAAGLTLWKRGERDPQLWLAGGVILLGAALVTGLALSDASASEVRAYWSEQLLSTEGGTGRAAVALLFLEGWAARILHDGVVHQGPLPGGSVLAVALAAAGCALLWRSGPRLRPHLLAGVLVVAITITASALRQLPVGVPRVETFLLPFGAVLCAAGVAWARRLQPAPIGAGLAVLLVSILLVQLPSARTSAYPREVAAPLVAELVRQLRPEDALWVNLHGSFALATYGPWPVRFSGGTRMGIVHPELQRPGFAILDLREGPLELPAPTAARTFVFLSHPETATFEDDVRRGMRQRGFRAAYRKKTPGCALMRFERGAPATASGAPAAR